MAQVSEELQCLGAMVGCEQMGGWHFGPSNARAMERDAEIVLKAMTQPVGTCVRDKAQVNDEQFSRACLTLIAEGVCLAMSGVLQGIWPEGADDDE